jgi:tRNA nucleotidyltransferase/poly(A) polymerase
MNNYEKALKFMSSVHALGYEAYLVGGGVICHLLDLPIEDIDIATNMPANIACAHFNITHEYKSFLTYKIDYNGTEIECAE